MRPSIRFAALVLVGLAVSAGAATASADHLHFHGTITPYDYTYSDGSNFDVYTVFLYAGQHAHVTMTSWEVDPYLLIECPEGHTVAQNDDGGSGYNAALTFRASETGYYRILANTFNAGDFGCYEVVVDVH